MNWRAGLASFLTATWLYLLFNSSDGETAKLMFERFNPAGLAAIAFLLAEPVARERIRKHRERPSGELEKGEEDDADTPS